MDRTTLETDVERMEFDLLVARKMLEAIVAKEDWGLGLDCMVVDAKGREGRVTMITFPNGRKARPWVWFQPMLASGKWKSRSRCLADKWQPVVSEKSADGEPDGVA